MFAFLRVALVMVFSQQRKLQVNGSPVAKWSFYLNKSLILKPYVCNNLLRATECQVPPLTPQTWRWVCTVANSMLHRLKLKSTSGTDTEGLGPLTTTFPWAITWTGTLNLIEETISYGKPTKFSSPCLHSRMLWVRQPKLGWSMLNYSLNSIMGI